MITKAERTRVHCAIYTRKSTEDGLEQEFNSLDAQRESAEAYIASQKSEGWVCLPDRYDDGGFTGGNMERPALKRLLADIEAGGVDIIVVYKVDRLSRSLIDFSKIMDVLERRNVSFVSVTQQFNTSTSMGRLMLNVLLSFAQFEREMISERTRDKIAATRRKGKWAGGLPSLGYDVAEGGGKLVVNEDEAVRVREIFNLYLERQSLIETVGALNERGWAMKSWTTQDGRERQGNAFSKNSLYRLLTNPLFVGRVRYKDEIYPGEHEAILDDEIFDRAQRLLKRNGQGGGPYIRNKTGALLRGLLVCEACQCGMVHSHSTPRGNKRYRYYVCANAQARGWKACPSPSVPAPEIERFVIDQIRAAVSDPGVMADTLDESRRRSEEAIGRLETERRVLGRELQRSHDALRRLVARAGEADTGRVADLQERISLGERRDTQIREEMTALTRSLVSREEVEEACRAFEPMWETLTTIEQVHVVNLLVRQIRYDGVNGKVSITFHETGIKTLIKEQERAGT